MNFITYGRRYACSKGDNVLVFLFRVYRPTPEFFTQNGDITITGEGLQISTYANSNTQPSACGAKLALTQCATAAVGDNAKYARQLRSLKVTWAHPEFHLEAQEANI